MLRKMYSENLGVGQHGRRIGENVRGLGSKKLDFQFYWSALLRNKWLIILFTALMTTLAVVYSMLAVPVYSANATLLLESQKANIVSVEDLVSTEQESNDYYGTQYAILKSRALAERVVLQLENSGEVTPHQLSESLGYSSTTALSSLNQNQYNDVINQFRDNLNISPVVKTKLVKISYESTDPTFAALAANTVANQYINNTVDQRKSRKSDASEWMETRVQELKVKLDKSEDELLAYKKANGLVDLNGDVGQLFDQQLISNSSELSDAKRELASSTNLYNKTQSFKRSSPDLLETLPYIQNDVTVRGASTDLAVAERSIAELRNRYGERHPRVVDARSRIASQRSTLDSNIRRAVATFENDYQLLRQRVASLESNVAQGRESAQDLGQKKITLDAMEREVAANREQYNGLFNRITEIRTTDGLDEANAVVSEAAWVPTKAVKPNKTLIVGIVMLASLLFASAIACLREFLDDTVNTKADIEQRLKTRLLGVIPRIERKMLQKKTEKPLAPGSAVDSSDTFVEAINTCRTALSIGSRKDAKVILITSSVANEGKSTVAINLAHSFGQIERTLLIDCDLRRPSVARALGYPLSEPGLSNLLLNKSVTPGIIKTDTSEAFECLTSGPMVENPLELLASEKFSRGLDSLREHYDRIIIDSAPTHVVSDAIVLSQLADTTLYVVKPHETQIKLVENGIASITESGASVAGICISQMNMKKAKSHGDLEFHGLGLTYHGYSSVETQKDDDDDNNEGQMMKLAS